MKTTVSKEALRPSIEPPFPRKKSSVAANAQSRPARSAARSSRRTTQPRRPRATEMSLRGRQSAAEDGSPGRAVGPTAIPIDVPSLEGLLTANPMPPLAQLSRQVAAIRRRAGDHHSSHRFSLPSVASFRCRSYAQKRSFGTPRKKASWKGLPFKVQPAPMDLDFWPGLRRGAGSRIPNRDIGLGTILLLQLRPDAGECAMQRDLVGVRLQPEHRADLASAEIGPVAQGDELSAAVIQSRDRARERQALEGARFEVVRSRLLEIRRAGLGGHVTATVNNAAGNPDQPGEGPSAARVIARPVLQRPFEDLAREVFGIGPIPNPVGHIGVDPSDQGSR